MKESIWIDAIICGSLAIEIVGGGWLVWYLLH